jgi:membrane protein
MNDAPKSVRERLRRLLFHDVWDIDLTSLSSVRAGVVRFVRIVHLATKGFREDNLPLHASALTFSTLVALVPILAVALSMARGLGAGQELMARLNDLIADMPDQIREYLEDVINQVNTTNFYAIGTTGGFVLLAMVIQMLSSIEASFNRIWRVSRSRNLLRRGANYISTLVVVPVLVLAAGAAVAFFEPLIQRLGGAAVYGVLLQLSPLLATWFGFLYVYMPNTRVHAGPAFASGLLGAVLWLTWLRFYVAVQPGVSGYGVIYGTLASVPIFLAWLYVSWVIILLGAEIAFAVQNATTYSMERAAPRASIQAKLILALAVVSRAAETLASSKGPFESEKFARDRSVSIRLVNEILALLCKAGLLAEIAEAQGRYVLLKAPERIAVKEVIDIILRDGSQPEELGLAGMREVIQDVLSTVDESMERSLNRLTILDLLPKSAS